MTKNINVDWASQFIKPEQTQETQRNVDWVGKKEFKRLLKFKVLPANSQENGRIGGATVTARHWNIGPNHDQSCLCVEKMFPDQGMICPVCQLKRDLLKAGFTEEDLQTPGKFGPIDMFEPTVQSNVKVVVIDTDVKQGEWDQSHISVLQMNSNYLVRWLVETYLDQDTPDFLDINDGNLIKFSRDADNAKWERQLLDSAIKWNVSQEVKDKIKAENEEFTLSDLWKFPSDDEFLRIKRVCEDWKTALEQGKTQQETTLNDVMNVVASPF